MDKTVDFMENMNDKQYMFNQTPISKSRVSDKEKGKNRKIKEKKKRISEYIREEDEDQFDIMEQKLKKVKGFNKELEEENEFELYNDDMESYFLMNEVAFQQYTEVPVLNYTENTYLLSRVQEHQTK